MGLLCRSLCGGTSALLSPGSAPISPLQRPPKLMASPLCPPPRPEPRTHGVSPLPRPVFHEAMLAEGEDIVRLVEDLSGDRIERPVVVIGWAEPESLLQRAAIFVVHDDTGRGGSVRVSFAYEDLPLTPSMFRTLALRIFFDFEASEVLVRVRHADRDLRAALRRLGFADRGLDGDRRLLVLTVSGFLNRRGLVRSPTLH
jgi:hypothetical protein